MLQVHSDNTAYLDHTFDMNLRAILYAQLCIKLFRNDVAQIKKRLASFPACSNAFYDDTFLATKGIP